MLLDVASELPDHEPLVQKHFFALLSSVWRAKTRNERKRSLSSSHNNHYSYQRFFNPTANHVSHNTIAQPSVKMKFTNLRQSSKLVAAALYESHNTRPDERFSVYNQREEVSAVADHMVVTLELPRETDDPTVQLPSVVNVSIRGADPSTSSNMPIRESHNFRSSLHTAENHFR